MKPSNVALHAAEGHTTVRDGYLKSWRQAEPQLEVRTLVLGWDQTVGVLAVPREYHPVACNVPWR